MLETPVRTRVTACVCVSKLRVARARGVGGGAHAAAAAAAHMRMRLPARAAAVKPRLQLPACEHSTRSRPRARTGQRRPPRPNPGRRGRALGATFIRKRNRLQARINQAPRNCIKYQNSEICTKRQTHTIRTLRGTRGSTPQREIGEPSANEHEWYHESSERIDFLAQSDERWRTEC